MPVPLAQRSPGGSPVIRPIDRAAWIALGDRLAELSPAEFEEVTVLVREIVESEEVIQSYGRGRFAREPADGRALA